MSIIFNSLEGILSFLSFSFLPEPLSTIFATALSIICLVCIVRVAIKIIGDIF